MLGASNPYAKTDTTANLASDVAIKSQGQEQLPLFVKQFVSGQTVTCSNVKKSIDSWCLETVRASVTTSF